jgi:hypothetical protein
MWKAPEIVFAPKRDLLNREIVLVVARLHQFHRCFAPHHDVLIFGHSTGNRLDYLIIETANAAPESLGGPPDFKGLVCPGQTLKEK